MKGVVLAGGLGSRLYPLTYATNKHLLPVYDKPMVYYPIQTLVQAGITHIMIVVGGPHAGDFMGVLRNGKSFGIGHLEYAFQENEGGIAQALALCEDFADGGELAVILGDNTTDADIRPVVAGFAGGACIFLKPVADPHRFGVPEFDASDPRRIVHIDEKPKDPKSNYAVTGLYLYDGKVFEYIRRTKPSGRGELEISDVNNFYIQDGRLTWAELQGFWSDAGTFESLYRTGKFWAEKALGST
jgi:glucose-1-phosphate thymidylyltransferase